MNEEKCHGTGSIAKIVRVINSLILELSGLEAIAQMVSGSETML